MVEVKKITDFNSNAGHRYYGTPEQEEFKKASAIDQQYPDFSYWRSNDATPRGFEILGKEGLYFGRPVYIILREITKPGMPVKRVPLDVFAEQVRVGSLFSFIPKI